MKCPNCGSERSQVLDSRTQGDSIRRRKRECLNCLTRYITHEQVLSSNNEVDQLIAQIDELNLIQASKVLVELSAKIDELLVQQSEEREDSRPVRSIDTGIEYPSVSYAAKLTGSYASNICQAITKNQRAAGQRWEYVEPSEDQEVA